MRAVGRICIALLVLVTVPSCGIADYYLKESTLLVRRLNVIAIYLAEEALVAEDEGNKERYLELYEAEDELAEACTKLQEATFKKLFNEVITFGLKITTAFSLPTCEDKINEIQKRFPEYKNFNPT